MHKVVGAFVLTSAVAVSPMSAVADDEPGLGATFAATATAMPNTQGESFCGGSPLGYVAVAHGAGFSSVLGPLSLFLQKTLDIPSGPMHGCVTLTSPSGNDSLLAILDGSEGLADANGFSTDAKGTLTVIRAKGKFYGMKGLTVPFTASFFVVNSSSPPSFTVSAFYSVD
jgi:hypothetical protein